MGLREGMGVDLVRGQRVWMRTRGNDGGWVLLRSARGSVDLELCVIKAMLEIRLQRHRTLLTWILVYTHHCIQRCLHCSWK